MAVAKVQSASGNAATVVLNGCVAANALICQTSYFRATSTGVAETTPTDSNGTFTISRADAPPAFSINDIGTSIFHQQNINAGTHTVTPQANSEHYQSLGEYSGLSTTGLFVAGSATSSKTANGAGTIVQSTGTTSTAATVGDLAVINLGLAGTPGAANVGLTNPVTGYTTLQVSQDDLTTIAVLQSFRILAAGGTQSETFNWTDSASTNSSHAAIATFVAAASSVSGPPIMGHMIMVNP